MHDLIDGVARFQQLVVPAKAAQFARLASTHNPATLFIGCCDARVVPEDITQSDPGVLFVIRTAGNLVPAFAPGTADGVAASIEYAVAVLGVTDIVICGHSACGAMTALAQGHDVAAAPAVTGWLRHADASKARTATAAAGADNLSALDSQNVVAQLANLTTHPAVTAALAQHALALHGWVYDIGTGTVSHLDPATNEFIAISSERPPCETSARTTSAVGFAPAEPA